MEQLPPGQRRVLEYYADAEERGHQASRLEAADDLGYAFPSAVTKHIEALARKGLVTSDRIIKRNVRLTEAGWTALGRVPAERGIPVIGSIAAGTPILASENHLDYLTDLVPQAGRFALMVRGDSMEDVGILDGDFAIVDQASKVDDGTIAAVIVEDEDTLKRVRYRGKGIQLHPENKKYKPMRFSGEQAADSLRVIGPLAFVYRQVT